MRTVRTSDPNIFFPIGLVLAKMKEDTDSNYIPRPGGSDEHVDVDYKGKKRGCWVGLAIANILIKMKMIAEAYVGKEVKNAVVAVPAYFNGSARQVTHDEAAKSVGRGAKSRAAAADATGGSRKATRGRLGTTRLSYSEIARRGRKD